MRRFWIGVGLLLGMLVLGIFVTESMAGIHEPIGKTLLEAGDLAFEEDWAGADAAFLQARGLWEQYREVTAVVTDHTPMEQIDAMFRRLEVYRQQRQADYFRSGCAELSACVEAVADAQAVNWWSIL